MSRSLYAYTYADVPFDDAVTLLADDPEGLLQKATNASAAHGDDLIGNLQATLVGFEVSRDVAIELGGFELAEPLRGILPLRWRAARGHVLFPTLDAQLEVSTLSLHPPVVQVTLAGSYNPPLGTVGAVLDQLFDQRLVDAVIHRFLDEVARRLESLVRATIDIPRSA